MEDVCWIFRPVDLRIGVEDFSGKSGMGNLQWNRLYFSMLDFDHRMWSLDLRPA